MVAENKESASRSQLTDSERAHTWKRFTAFRIESQRRSVFEAELRVVSAVKYASAETCDNDATAAMGQLDASFVSLVIFVVFYARLTSIPESFEDFERLGSESCSGQESPNRSTAFIWISFSSSLGDLTVSRVLLLLQVAKATRFYIYNPVARFL